MNNSSMYSPIYRPNQQQYVSPAAPSATRPPRPRFSNQVPHPYPRPRSSASKPNPTSSHYPTEDDRFYDNNNYFMQNSSIQSNDDLYSSRNASFLSDSSFSSALDTSFSERPGFNGNRNSANMTPIGTASFPANNYLNSSPGYSNYLPGSANLQSLYKNMYQPVPPVVKEKTPEPQKKPNFKIKNRAMKRKAPTYEHPRKCDLCNLDFTSQVSLDMHLRGTRHMKKIKAIQALKLLQSQGHAKAADVVDKAIFCETCKVSLNGALQLQTHYEGAKHKNKTKELEAALNPPQEDGSVEQNGKSVKPTPEVVVVQEPAEEPKSAKLGKFSCEICNIIMNSQTQLQQHLESNKHKAKVEGKPIPRKSKPKKKDANSATEEATGEAASEKMVIDNTTPKSPLHGILPLSSSFVQKDVLN